MKTYDILFDTFTQLNHMLFDDGNEDILALPYAQYSLQLYASYKKRIVREILYPGSRCSKMFASIGVIELHDQFLHIIYAFYLSRHAHDEIDI